MQSNSVTERSQSLIGTEEDLEKLDETMRFGTEIVVDDGNDVQAAKNKPTFFSIDNVLDECKPNRKSETIM